jgi:ABC-type transport system substrate-binding protein
LRKGILFHDGTSFNADAAKWNLDRLQYMINATGTNYGVVAHTQSLWMFPDEETFIIDTVTTVGEYNITITLNGAYGPLLNTLAYINAGMISPTAHVSHATSFIPLTTGDVIGTGPFMYDYFTPNEGVYLSRWEGYWKNLANFKRIKFAIIPDSAERNQAMLDKFIDFLIGIEPSFIPSFENDSSIAVKRFTDDTGKPSLVYQYLGFNNKRYNVTWRKAMSYAVNYTYILEELRQGDAIRANSPISPSFGSSYNVSSRGADYNITKAREIMVSMGFGNMSWTDAQWVIVAESPSPFHSVGFTYNVGNTFQEDLYFALFDWFKLIGVELYDNPWEPWWYPWDNYDYLHLYALGWGPDYLDPFNMLDPLFNPISSSNYAQVNDTTLDAMMALALETTDDAARNNIYKDIQWYMSEVGYFHVYLYHSKIYYVHSADLYGVPYNAMERFEAYGIRRA